MSSRVRNQSQPLNSVRLTDEEFLARRDDHLEIDVSPQAASAAMILSLQSIVWYRKE